MPKQRQKRDQDGIFARPDSPYWWASFVDGVGQATRRSTGIRREDDPRKDQARLVRAEWVRSASDEKANTARCQNGHTFDELMLRYLSGPSQAKRSARRDQFSAKRLYPFFSGRLIEDLRGPVIREYIDQRIAANAGNGTINRELSMLQSAVNWSRKHLDWDVVDPVKGRKLKEAPPRTRWLSQDETDALLAAAAESQKAPHLVDFVRLALNTGMRHGELLKLEWNRVDLEQRLIYLGVRDQKNENLGSIPINSEAFSAIQVRRAFRDTHCPSSPWVFCDGTGRRIISVRKSFATAVRIARLDHAVPHDLRRTCGSRLAQIGVPIQTVSAVLRHSDIRITDKVYAHLAPHVVRAALEQLDV